MATNAPMPTKDPPYPSSIFPDSTQHIFTILSYLLGCHTDQWVDEAMIGFLSILSSDSKPSVIFNYAQFLADTIHDQFLNLDTKEVNQEIKKTMQLPD